MKFIRRLRKKIHWHVIDLIARLGIGDQAVLNQGYRPAYGKASPRTLSVPLGEETFIAHDALHGSLCDAALAETVPSSVWAKAGTFCECIRYYPSGLNPEANNLALIYFSGDVILRTRRGVRRVSDTYTQQSPDLLTAQMRKWSQDAGAPAIFIGRPGIFGSSGDHEKRRQPYEIDLMDKALDLIGARHRIARFILVGQSGGGQIVAALLNRRHDIAAGIMAAGLLSVEHTVRNWRRRRPVPGGAIYPVEALYDPLREVAQIHRKPAPEIFIISDPRDSVISLYSQLIYLRSLRAEGLSPYHIYAHATGAKRHYLAHHGRKTASLVARGKTILDIRRGLVELDMENLGEHREMEDIAREAAHE